MLQDSLKTKILNADKIAVFTHTHPDGDALGSAFSFKLAMQGMGKQAEVFLEKEPHTPAYSIVNGKEPTNLKPEDCALKVALDCADCSRLGDLQGLFCGNTIAIDHHVTHVPFAENTLVVPDASATAEILYGVYRELDIPVTPEIAHNLYIAIVSDTGNFKYSCATAHTHRVAAELIETGADFAEITKVLFDTKSFAYYQLMRAALDKLELFCDGKVAVLSLSMQDFENSGLDEEGADGIVTLPRSIEGVEVGVYIRQRGDREYKVSLRSNRYADVAAVAGSLQGGGHVHAAGYSAFEKTEEEVKRELMEQLVKIV